ncbi:MAG: Methylthioribose-1-phosphate isomerase [Caldanaerobacter subterraneus]|jgi:methylthioribose-1-phosphate isomerase|uniref:Methylthioribose-1-phosphate isomerase n=3 Tax=Thermoanaerobacter TaxID=1754 RepID=MTNA_THEP3|nr:MULTISPECIES: S-methyl-5-thioribose-1-phosphate isomerase [Thermoanaerobacter]B0K2V6.1 RecName: Full=Methylthioribose-1-phosphate isomerase; Short=M1Pi; Short=MTR-1-P isomerase; AltName: Full=S-methyl-5-thioribose-1-phosphate isomerase [Thermoanaerobacter sp. X514]B0K8S2.1 RecName: Full=Methylthioribose-1-phosphate isomerase; Short=M1Pi; Short=MTR-1-P isomerase; AltName: Full=S-methyl-5-thioribose-1-phosphate isomerase [Thermoanaerobacter pseudethanolicus ATCC 33223]KUJ90661.1 MAG: translatio
MKEIKSIEFKNEVLYLIDQRKLPNSYEIFECKTYRDVNFAIKEMVVRGAPAIGAAAAYGVVLAAKEFLKEDREIFFEKIEEALEVIANSRPTAVNLMWAVKRMKKVIEKNKELELIDIYQALKKEADSIYLEDIETNKKMAKFGNEVIKENAVILTHCNTGALATVGYGTALGVIREAHYSGKNIFVYADETRPRLQGSKLTAWELVQEGIPAKLIADSVAATLIRDGKIDVILVGADRIALNGDTANKIGTFMLSVIAKVYNVPFYVVAPTSTIDFEIESGKEIIIEERSPEEVTHINGVRIAPEGIEVYNPAFDVTPHENITGIITEKGIIKPPYKENILKLK